MSRFILHGKKPLDGTLTLAGNKNAALPMLAASVLTDEPLTLRNIPDIDDVRVMLELLEDLGVAVARHGRTVTLCAAGLHHTRLDSRLGRKVRSSILLAGPLAARHGSATLPPPGGDVIGRRRLDTHFSGLKELGIQIRTDRLFKLKRIRLKSASLLLDEASVTATENLMMAAVLAPGRTTLYHAACEPHVQDLGALLNKMGAQIEGLGTNRLIIQGVKKLNGTAHTVGSDFIELGSFAAAAAVTGGSLKLKAVHDSCTIQVLEKTFNRLGVRWKRAGKNTLSVPSGQSMQIRDDLHAAVPKVEDGIWPAFPSDLMSVCLVLATQSKGTVLFFEKLFESRMYFVDQLISMGARIIQCDPHRVVINGPSPLRSAHMASPDIRAGMALLIAALGAEGTSVIDNAHVIDRGYERIDERLRSVGADIERET